MRISVLWLWFVGMMSLAAVPGMSDREVWTNAFLRGSPEPPPPFTVERLFPRLELKAPIYVADEPGSDRLWVVLQGGEADRPSRIVQFAPQPEVSTHELVFALPGRLIYGLTFHPGYTTNRQVFLFSNGPTGAAERTNRVSRFEVAVGSTVQITPGSERVILEWRSAGHDGGDLAFGKDGMLYITAGDGTSDSDGWNSGQDISNLLATLIRIDVDHPPADAMYAVPQDNPFIGVAGARPEIWAFGFRNPWRMSIDRLSGDIWVGNNGQDLWETAYLVHRGDNFGWSVTEGSHPFYAQRRRGPAPIVAPTVEHSHADFRSLTGGVVYRGRMHPDLEGTYIYGDYATGKIWGARHRDGKLIWNEELADTTLQIAAFRNDQQGNLLVVDHGGGLYRLIRRKPESLPPFPRKLSETGLFTSTADHALHPGLIPYEVNAPGWMDGAIARRWMALPESRPIQYAATRGWGFTNGSVLVQTVSLPAAGATPARRLETRLLIRQENEWTGYSFRWNEAQTDAELVPAAGEVLDLSNPRGGSTRQSWRVPSRAECMACHARAVGFVLSASTVQMNRPRSEPDAAENQLAYLARIGALHGFTPDAASATNRLVNPYDDRADLSLRARSYLHANCSVCHVEAGGGNAQMELEFNRETAAMRLVGARPQHDALNLVNAMLVAPGEPDRSVLLARVSRRGRGQMPPLVTSRVDEQAVALFRDWIRSMKPVAAVKEWTMADFSTDELRGVQKRSIAQGEAAFKELGCVQCHRLGSVGGSVGPDLTGLSQRVTSPRDVLESILEPSKVLAEGYANYEFQLRDGSVVSGQIESEDAREVVFRGASGVEAATRIARDQVQRRQMLPISNMPAGMVNTLEKGAVLDLLAYVLAGGKSP